MPPSQETENLAPVLGALAARGYAVESTAPMPGDVSRRTYHRLTLASGAPAVLAVYPADLRDACRRSLATGRLLAARGVRVARELDHDCQAGWVLLEDLGPRTLYEEAHRPWSELAAFFEDAVRCIGRIATLAPAEVAALNPPLDGDLLRRELAQTREVFLAPLGLLDGRLADELAEAFERLASDYSGYYGAIGRYYAGASYLHFDRDKGLSLLEQVANMNDHPTSDLARLALAESCAADGDYEKAISLYQQLLSSSPNLKPAVEVGLGRVYEKTGDLEKAVEAYLEAAKPDRSSGAGAEAEKRLSAIAPDRLKDLPSPSTLPVTP